MGPKQETPQAPPAAPAGRPQLPPPPKPKVALAQLADDCLQIMDDKEQPEIVHRLAGIGRQLIRHVQQIKAAVKALAEARETDLRQIGEHFEQMTGVLEQITGLAKAGTGGPPPPDGQAPPEAEGPPPAEGQVAGAAEGAPPAAAQPPAAGPVPQTRAERLAARLAATQAQQKKAQ